MHPRSAQRTLERCRQDPVFFAKHVLGVTLWGKQKRILESVRDNRRTAVRACRGVGKTFVAAVIVLWFLYSHGPNTMVVTTAPTQRQVRELLWSEIRSLHARADDRGFTLGGTPSSVRLELDEDWLAIGLSSNDPDKYLGFHAHHILFVVDEVSGVDMAILDAAKGYGTSFLSRTLYIGNGTQTSGGLYDAFTAMATLWERHAVSMFDSPNFTEAGCAEYPRVVEYMTRKKIPYATEKVPKRVARALPGPAVVDDALVEWGEDSPLFAVFVLGEFPGEGANTVIGVQAVMDAQARYEDWEPTEGVSTADITCDVARFGDDETVIGTREHGDIDRVTVFDTYNGQDTVWTTGAIMRAAEALELLGVTLQRIVVDDAGVGGGVTDQLRANQRAGLLPSSVKVIGFNGGGRAKKRGKGGYPNARSEAWFAFQESLPTIALDPMSKLLADLVAPTYELDGAGRRVVERKKDTKKRLKRSPDHADMALMAYAPSGLMTVARKAKRSVYR